MDNETPSIQNFLYTITDSEEFHGVLGINKKIKSDFCFNLQATTHPVIKFDSLGGISSLNYETVRFLIPEGYSVLVFPRSSIVKKNLILANCVPVVDQDYTGNVRLCYRVLNHHIVYKVLWLFKKLGLAKNANYPLAYQRGDYIAQAKLVPNGIMRTPTFELTEDFDTNPIVISRDPKRGSRGFGHTDKLI